MIDKELEKVVNEEKAILHNLGLSRVDESDMLYVKLDFSKNPLTLI